MDISENFPSQRLPALGVGVGYREPFLGELLLNQREVGFLEIVADHFLDASSRKLQELELLQDHFPLIPHGLNMSLGSADGLDRDYLKQFACLVEKLNPPWWSEHVAFTRAGGIEIGHLAPLPRTREAVDVLRSNIRAVGERIAAPLLLENITYTVEMPGAELTEPQFLYEVAEQTGCGLLLDVTNLYTNCVNHGGDVETYLAALPLERVVQLHFVGGHWSGGTLIDSHSAETPAEVWAVLEKVLSRAPVRGVILERDENLPPFHELLPEIRRANALGKAYGRWQ